MASAELIARLRREVDRRRDLAWEELELEHRAGRWPFVRIASRDIGPRDRVMLLRAGVHGDETAGPLTLARELGAIADRAHARGVKLILYPLANPSGFERSTRYNADADRGDCGNNAFLDYELGDGTLCDDLGRGRAFRRWYWSSDPCTGRRLPEETRLLHHRLQRDPLRQIVAVLDLHQDHISQIAAPAAYHYGFGDLSRYRPIVARLEPLVPILRHRVIAAGQRSGLRTDRNGFLVRHDGTLCDLFHRLGTPHAITAETLGATPIERACEVNRTWIDGLIDLAAQPDAGRKRSLDEEVRRRLDGGSDLYRTDWLGQLPVVRTRHAPPGAPRILLSAGLHGDEPAGVLALLQLLERDLTRYARRFAFVILPCLNPDGFERGLRTGAGGVDINRAFGAAETAPEAELVKGLLAEEPGPFELALDLHETDTYAPPGGGFGVEDNPASFYLYEQRRGSAAAIGRRVIAALRRDGVPVTRRRSIYGAECSGGLISTPAPGHPDYPDRPEFLGTLDWYLLSRRHTDHFLATETPTAWPLHRRISVQRRTVRLALDLLGQAASGRRR